MWEHSHCVTNTKPENAPTLSVVKQTHSCVLFLDRLGGQKLLQLLDICMITTSSLIM